MSLVRSLLPFLLLLAWMPMTGCSNDHTSSDGAPMTHHTEDAQSGARLSLQLASDSIGIADRMWVTARWSWPDSVSVSIAPPDWDEGDWTPIETIDEPVARDGDHYEASRRWLVEPFLPGEYSVPSPVMLIEAADATRELAVDPFVVQVQGVLPDQDTGQLNPLATPALPESPNDTRPVYWLWAVAITSLIALVVLAIARRGSHADQDETVYAQLKHIETNEQLDSGVAFELLDRAFAQLDPRLRQTSEFTEMIRACDRARFAQDHGQRVSPTRIARHALELLGHDSTPSARGGAA
ncbi:MAG: hypothetical protein CMJ35_02190 [Phycisphaerae bacterium]|nr:hypothetical protein [Phycisphaerae bacterium]MBM90408.1 hypothetical protein [Phycisphaerae bacterium]